MHKILFQSVFLEDFPRGRIHFSASYPCLDGSDRGLLRFLNRPVPFPHALACTPHMHGTRHVAAIVAEYSTQVQHDQLIFPQLLSRRPSMRHRTPAPRSHNRFKGTPSGPVPFHLILHLLSPLPLPPSPPPHLPPPP